MIPETDRFGNHRARVKNYSGPAKTYILRDTQCHCGSMQFKPGDCDRQFDNETPPPQGERRARKGNRWPCVGNQGPVVGTAPLLIARKPFQLHRFLLYLNCRGSGRSLGKAHFIGALAGTKELPKVRFKIEHKLFFSSFSGTAGYPGKNPEKALMP